MDQVLSIGTVALATGILIKRLLCVVLPYICIVGYSQHFGSKTIEFNAYTVSILLVLCGGMVARYVVERIKRET